MRKNILVIIFLVVGLGGGMSLGVIFSNPAIEQAKNDRDYWQNEYYNLLDDYNALFSNFEALQDALENPLTNPDTPTISQIIDWLDSDNTDSFEYTEDWMCGDFAAMLMTRAKTMNWRMRISCMFWSYNGDSGWQDPAHPYGSYGHAFNIILCQDYDGDGIKDWFYIEPQTDKVWYVSIGAESFVHYEIWYTFTGGIDGTVWSEPYFINHYSYFA